MKLPMTQPRQPAELWSLWTVTHENPEGFWWNHASGFDSGSGSPMTFVSREDAEKSAESERHELADGESMVAAPIAGMPSGIAGQPSQSATA